MLVLGRFPDQQILIDGGIRITIVYVRGNKVGLGIEAPDGTTILRSELYDGSDIPQKLPRESKSSSPQATSPEREAAQQAKRDYRRYYPSRGIPQPAR